MRRVLDLLVATGLLMLLIAWCVGCMAVPLWVVTLLPVDGMAERILALIAAGFGLWCGLWTVAKLTHSRM